MERRKHFSTLPWAVAILALLAWGAARSRQTTVLFPASVAASSRPPNVDGDSAAKASPTHSLANPVLPRGTPIVVRLQSSLSSAVAHRGDVFTAVLDRPVVAGGETLAATGTVVNGRVVLANSTGNAYLELTLSSITIDGSAVVVHTSAVFVKSSPHAGMLGTAGQSGFGNPQKQSDQVKFSTDRQLVFWLVQSLPVTS